MKDKPTEWVSIADLMAGVMAVVMLLLVMAVLQKTYAEFQHQESLAKQADTQQQRTARLLERIKVSVQGAGGDGLVAVDVASAKIMLGDGVFARGSACVTDQARQAASEVSQGIQEFLASVPQAKVYVEGHTDNLPVGRPVTDFARFCTVYDDNFTLSAARAREARKLLLTVLSEADSRRVVVAGYGESQPLPGLSPGDARNRRIEVRLVATQ
jgi:chemotaxis protein MotB